jgi:hypothetical protein
VKQMEELQRRWMIEEAKRLAPYRQSILASFEHANRQALQSVLEATRKAQLEYFKRNNEEIRAITRNMIAPRLAEEMAVLRSSISSDIFKFSAASAVAQTIKAMRDIQQGMAAETHSNLLAYLTSFEHAPVFAALETMRHIGLQDVSPEFNNFVEETLKQPATLDREAIAKRGSDLVKKQKIQALTPERQAKLNLCINILMLFITFYTAILAGQPLKIDPVQLQQLQSSPSITFNFILPSEQYPLIYYEVQRPVDMKLRPNHRSLTIARLDRGQEVRLVRMAHKWIYVEYSDEGDVPLIGWIDKKYLSRIN